MKGSSGFLLGPWNSSWNGPEIVCAIGFAIMCGAFLYHAVYYCDAPYSWQMGFQDPATPVMEGIIDFHNHLMFFVVLVVTLVCWILYEILNRFTAKLRIDPKQPHLGYQFYYAKPAVKFSHAALLEIVWTLFPTIILMVVAVPSFALLYAIDAEVGNDRVVTIKAIGHQWYWHYEYGCYDSIRAAKGREPLEFDSYALPLSSIYHPEHRLGDLRLLTTDNRVFLPANAMTRVIVTSSDVIHSWAVPSFGVKIDAIPGRLNVISFFIKRDGMFFGQCSEICGINHGFMPIAICALDSYYFHQCFVPAMFDIFLAHLYGRYDDSFFSDVITEGAARQTWNKEIAVFLKSDHLRAAELRYNLPLTSPLATEVVKKK